MAVAFRRQFAVDAVFHPGTAASFSDYSPGMVTAATVTLPATVMVSIWLCRENPLPSGQPAAALGIGTAVAGAEIDVQFVG